jgi:Flp pilus assembly protein protease CpaA
VLLSTAIVAAVCAVAAWIDVRTHRIPNALTLPAIAVGLIMTAFLGWRLLALRLLTVLVVLVAAIAMHAIGVWGGGDGKLVAAIAALKGFPFAAESAIWTFLIGGFVALCVLIRKRTLLASLRSLGNGPSPAVPPTHIPFGPLIAAGVAVTLLTEALGFRSILMSGFPNQ